MLHDDVIEKLRALGDQALETLDATLAGFLRDLESNVDDLPQEASQYAERIADAGRKLLSDDDSTRAVGRYEIEQYLGAAESDATARLIGVKHDALQATEDAWGAVKGVGDALLGIAGSLFGF